MATIWDKIVKFGLVIVGAISGALGGWSWVLTVLLAFMAVDYISGLIVATMGKSLKSESGGLSSKAGVNGLLRKGLMLMVVLVAALLDRAVGSDGNMFRDAVCWFYMANEGISLMENLTLAGVPFPKKLKDMFTEKLKDEEIV